MKKQFITRLFVSLTITFATSFLFAQDQNLVAANHFKLEINGITAVLEKAVLFPTTATVYVKAKVMRSFLDLFSNASDVRWSESSSRYFASFKQNGKWCKALFDSKGGLIFSIRYSAEKDLPRDVRRLLKSTYVDFTIGPVTEVHADNLHAWVVNLTDGDNLIIASVHDGTLTEMHHYKTHF